MTERDIRDARAFYGAWSGLPKKDKDFLLKQRAGDIFDVAYRMGSENMGEKMDLQALEDAWNFALGDDRHD